MTDSISDESLAARIERFQERFGMRLENPGYLAQALVISDDVKAARLSGVSQHGLQSIGDAVLTTVVRERMLVRYAGRPTDFTPSCNLLLSNRFLARICRSLGLHKYAEISANHAWAQATSEAEGAWHQRADLLEGIIGAFYMDSGFDTAKEFVLNVLWPEFVELAPDPSLPNPQTLLRARVQEKFGVQPIFRLQARVRNPSDKSKPLYKVDVSANKKVLAYAMEPQFYNAQRRSAVMALIRHFDLTAQQVKEKTSW